MIEEYDIPNIVTTVGKNFVASRLSSNTPLVMSHMAVGSSQTPQTVGDTILKQELLINSSMNETVRHYAMNSKKAGLDGEVCSPLEAPIIKGRMKRVNEIPELRMAMISVLLANFEVNQITDKNRNIGKSMLVK
mgnify:CR=1 FL=1